MSGRDKSAENAQRQLAQQQLDLSNKQLAASDTRLSNFDAMIKPQTDFLTSLTSNNPHSVATALAPQLSNLSAATRTTQQQIQDSMPQGSARDFAMFTTMRDAPAQAAQLKNSLYMKSLSDLSGLGGQQAQLGLQQAGLGETASGQSASINSQLSQQAVQRKSATMGAIGQAAGIAGNVATGGASAKAKSPGGSSASSVARTTAPGDAFSPETFNYLNTIG